MPAIPLKPAPDRTCERVDLRLTTAFDEGYTVTRMTCDAEARFLLPLYELRPLFTFTLALCPNCYRTYLENFFGRN